MLDVYGYNAPEVQHGDEWAPGNNCKRGCKFEFRSDAAAERHEILFHLDARRNDMRKNRKNVSENTVTKEYVCKVCGHKATSYHYLRKHKNEEGHKR